MPSGYPGSTPPCSVEGCESTGRTTRGLCDKHYMRWRVHGDPSVARGTSDRSHLRGTGSASWKGDAAGYAAAHKRLHKARGKASEHVCRCGARAHEWAFDEPHGYSFEFDRYEPLCVSCHRKQDLGAAALG